MSLPAAGLALLYRALAHHDPGAHGRTGLVAHHALPQDLVEQVGRQEFRSKQQVYG